MDPPCNAASGVGARSADPAGLWNDTANAGSFDFKSGQVSANRALIEFVPEPATLLLLGCGLAILAVGPQQRREREPTHGPDVER